MGYPARIETTNIANLLTTRSRNSELWFVNNSRLETSILGYLAKYSERHSAEMYGFAVEGNHIQAVAHFPKGNRAAFMRDFNSSVARAIPRAVTRYPGGRFWARRYSAEYLLEDSDIERKFFYVVLQAVQDGLVDRIADYPGYNCFHDAVNGIIRTYETVNWKGYYDAKRWNPAVDIEEFTESHELRFKRLPGYEHLSQNEYKLMMYRKLEEYRVAAIEKRAKPCAGRAAVLHTKPGDRPLRTKTSTRTSHRPRVLAKDAALRRAGADWYFTIQYQYQLASKRYRSGELTTTFPPGTYKPPIFTINLTVAPISVE